MTSSGPDRGGSDPRRSFTWSSEHWPVSFGTFNVALPRALAILLFALAVLVLAVVVILLARR